MADPFDFSAEEEQAMREARRASNDQQVNAAPPSQMQDWMSGAPRTAPPQRSRGKQQLLSEANEIEPIDQQSFMGKAYPEDYPPAPAPAAFPPLPRPDPRAAPPDDATPRAAFPWQSPGAPPAPPQGNYLPNSPQSANIEDRRHMTSPNNPFMSAADQYEVNGMGFNMSPERKTMLDKARLFRGEWKRTDRGKAMMGEGR